MTTVDEITAMIPVTLALGLATQATKATTSQMMTYRHKNVFRVYDRKK